LAKVTGVESFELNVCAGITDPDSKYTRGVIADAYTRMATAGWSVDASGNVTVNANAGTFTYTPTAQKPFTKPQPDAWKTLNDGTTVDPTLKAANEVGDKYDWHAPQ
jgi:hypothetical protein